MSGQKSSESQRIVNNLKRINAEYLRDIEDAAFFNQFHHDAISDQELDAKPMILVVGQYSTGKTTFINTIIGQDYSGSFVGPEPTTDRFIAACHGEEGRVLLGNAVSVSQDLPFQGLTRFGQGFLNKFSASFTNSDMLKDVTLVDTPGVLSGEKQRLNRQYDFSQVCRWFAERADMVLLLFDAHKLDISDEFKEIIMSLRGVESKVRCVLNKADQIDSERLVRVYGALLFNIGKILQTPEVVRVFIGSFWKEPLRHEAHRSIFEKDQEALMQEIADLPHNAASRKVDEMVRRVRLVKVQVCILGFLRSKMPYLWGHEKAKERLIDTLPVIFAEVQSRFALSAGDMPSVEEFADCLKTFDFRKLPKIDYNTLDTLQDLLESKIPGAIGPETAAKAVKANAVKEKAAAIIQKEKAETDFLITAATALAVLLILFLCAFAALVYLRHPAIMPVLEAVKAVVTKGAAARKGAFGSPAPAAGEL